MVGLTIGPADLLNIAAHSKVKLLAAIPPPALPVRDEGDGRADEVASDPPSPTTVQGDEDGDQKEHQGILEGDLALDDLPILVSGEDFEQKPIKRSLEGATGPVESKSAKMETREKHGPGDVKEKEVAKLPRFELSTSRSIPPTASGLLSSPMHAANIGRVSTYGGVDIYMEEEEGGEWSELYLEDLPSWMSSIGDEAVEGDKMAHLRWMRVFFNL